MVEDQARNQEQGGGINHPKGDLVVQDSVQGQRCLHDYFKPEVQITYNRVISLSAYTTEFELRPYLLNMVQNSLLYKLANADPVAHIKSFLEKCDTVHIIGITKEVIRMRLFLFSLGGKAKSLFQGLNVEIMTSWA
ncbi:hypothetical protein Syun_007021 [Stephania yunnanensis]|uniref:Uncharacterized protein n=1 Tax=Stephania yunnanensis TaxID=152371 RepID=A0AAP0L0B5_9MAGN